MFSRPPSTSLFRLAGLVFTPHHRAQVLLSNGGWISRRMLATEPPKGGEKEEEKKGFFGRMKDSVTNTFKEAQFKSFIKTFEKELDFEGKEKFFSLLRKDGAGFE